MAQPLRNRFEARALYLQLIGDAGPTGAVLTELAASVGVARTRTVLTAIAKEIQSGAVVYSRPTKGKPARLTIAEKYVPPVEKTRQQSSYTLSAAVLSATLELVKQSGQRGVSIKEAADKLGLSYQAASFRLQCLSADKLIVSVYANEGTRVKRWHTPENKPAPVVVVAEKKASIAKPVQPIGPVIIPANVKITRADPPKARFEFNPPPGWKGQISAAEARPWAQMVAG